MFRAPHYAALADDRALSPANGTDAAGTSTGAYHRYIADIQTGPNVSLRWSTDGVGSVSAINVWATCRKSDNPRLANDPNPVTNSLWGPRTPWKFIDTASVVSIPNGAATSGALDISGTGLLTLLIEVICTVSIPRFTLDLSVKAH